MDYTQYVDTCSKANIDDRSWEERQDTDTCHRGMTVLTLYSYSFDYERLTSI